MRILKKFKMELEYKNEQHCGKPPVYAVFFRNYDDVWALYMETNLLNLYVHKMRNIEVKGMQR